LLLRSMSHPNIVGKPDSGVAPQKGKGPFKSLPKLGGPPRAAPVANTAQPPPWALGLLSQMENISSRIGLLETARHQPKSFSEAAGSTANPVATGEPQIVVAPSQPAPAPKKGATDKPPKGVSGSGFTRIPNGKLVRNKRPTAKPLPLRQAKNWRAKATTGLVAFLKERGIGVDDTKPTEDSRYQSLVTDLENSKAYMAYVKSTEAPVQVHEWRELLPRSTPSKEGAAPKERMVSHAQGFEPSAASSAIPSQWEPSNEGEESSSDEEEEHSSKVKFTKPETRSKSQSLVDAFKGMKK